MPPNEGQSARKGPPLRLVVVFVLFVSLVAACSSSAAPTTSPQQDDQSGTLQSPPAASSPNADEPAGVAPDSSPVAADLVIDDPVAAVRELNRIMIELQANPNRGEMSDFTSIEERIEFHAWLTTNGYALDYGQGAGLDPDVSLQALIRPDRAQVVLSAAYGDTVALRRSNGDVLQVRPAQAAWNTIWTVERDADNRWIAVAIDEVDLVSDATEAAPLYVPTSLPDPQDTTPVAPRSLVSTDLQPDPVAELGDVRQWIEPDTQNPCVELAIPERARHAQCLDRSLVSSLYEEANLGAAWNQRDYGQDGLRLIYGFGSGSVTIAALARSATNVIDFRNADTGVVEPNMTLAPEDLVKVTVTAGEGSATLDEGWFATPPVCGNWWSSMRLDISIFADVAVDGSERFASRDDLVEDLTARLRDSRWLGAITSAAGVAPDEAGLRFFNDLNSPDWHQLSITDWGPDGSGTTRTWYFTIGEDASGFSVAEGISRNDCP